MLNLIKSVLPSYLFPMYPSSNKTYILHVDVKLKKPEIKKICEKIFETKVIKINTYILPPKKHRQKLKRVFVKLKEY